MQTIRNLATMAFVAVVATSPASANPTMAAQFCPVIESLAHTIMVRRQEGTTVATMMEIVDTAGSPELRTLAQVIVRDAYEVPRYRSDSVRNDAALDFAADAAVACWAGFTE